MRNAQRVMIRHCMHKNNFFFIFIYLLKFLFESSSIFYVFLALTYMPTLSHSLPSLPCRRYAILFFFGIFFCARNLSTFCIRFFVCACVKMEIYYYERYAQVCESSFNFLYLKTKIFIQKKKKFKFMLNKNILMKFDCNS
jgi:hypothetical protein